MMDSLLEHKHRQGTPLSSKNLREAVIIVMEERGKYVKFNVKNVTMDTLFQSPVTINTEKKDLNMTC